MLLEQTHWLSVTAVAELLCVQIAALLFMILAVIFVCYTWCEGLRRFGAIFPLFIGLQSLFIIVQKQPSLVYIGMSCGNWGCQIVTVWLGLQLEACVIHLPHFCLCFFFLFYHSYSLVSIVSRLWTGQPINLGFIPTRGTRLCLWGSPSLLFGG